MWKYVIYFVVLVSLSDADPTVNTSLGVIEGYVVETRGMRKVAAFNSVPYALPPVDELRFMAPVPVTPWEEPLNARKDTPACVGRNPYTQQKNIVGQEDCLYLNVYTPLDKLIKKPAKPLPVMVFIHGGGLMCGDSSVKMYGPQFLLDKDVVLVTTNYRLGPLGFLSTQDEHCPGNNGLKDQQLALKWVQQHIHNFAGDPNSVTIFGESAGASSVHFHMIAKSSRGLFHRAISESGTALVPWAAPVPGEALRQAFRLAKYLNCPQAPSKKMLACLRTKTAYDIIDTEFMFYTWDYEPMTPFKVVVEPDLPGAFLTEDPLKAINGTQVPWLTGINKDEGCLKSLWITNNDTKLEEYISSFEAIAPVTFYYELAPQSRAITKRIIEQYELDSKDFANLADSVLEAYSDDYFDYPMVRSVELTLRSPLQPTVYMYMLRYEATNSFSQIFGGGDGNYGVCHADDLMHLFPISFLTKPISQEDVGISHLMVTLWTNFATTGNPNLPGKVPFVWDPVSNSKKMEYLKIQYESAMDEHIADRSRFWGNLPIWSNEAATFRHGDEL